MDDGKRALFTINSQSPLPLYYQIKQNLLDIVSSGAFASGDMLPSENEMGEYYGVTRLTVRQAVGELVAEGILVRERGRGTFVAQQKLTHVMDHAVGFSERIRATGHTPSTIVVSFDVIPALSEFGEHLQIDQNDLVYRLVRIRCVDDEPNMIQTTYLSKSKFPGLDEVDYSTHSLYSEMEKRFGTLIVNLDRVFEPVLLGKKDAALLNAKPGSPALLMEVYAYDQHGQRVEFTQSLVRGDKSRIAIKVS
jgi:GntR family transcriptional regulator